MKTKILLTILSVSLNFAGTVLAQSNIEDENAIFHDPRWDTSIPDREMLAKSNTEEEGVVINGVRWATRNVDEPGTFAATPESAGKFYQWNRKKAWDSVPYPSMVDIDIYAWNGGDILRETMEVEDGIVGWDSTNSEGMEWEKANDPSPKGWRIPTSDEIKSLLDTTKVNEEWSKQNGVNGRKFTDKQNGNFIFLPAVGIRSDSNGELYQIGNSGRYWSSKKLDFGACEYLYCSGERPIYFERSHLSWNTKAIGISIRPIAVK